MKNIAVLMGGYSRESEVSLKSAATVVEHLDKSKYASYPILITKEKWVYVDSQNQEFVVDKNDFSVKKIIFIYSTRNNKSTMMFVEAIKGKKVKLEIQNYYIYNR